MVITVLIVFFLDNRWKVPGGPVRQEGYDILKKSDPTSEVVSTLQYTHGFIQIILIPCVSMMLLEIFCAFEHQLWPLIKRLTRRICH